MRLRNKAYTTADLYDYANETGYYRFLKRNDMSYIIYSNDGIRACCQRFLKDDIQVFKSDSDNMFKFHKITKLKLLAEQKESYSIKSTNILSDTKFIKKGYS